MSYKSPYFSVVTNFIKIIFLNVIFFLVGYSIVALFLSPWLLNLTEEKKKRRRERKRMSLLTKMISFVIFLPNIFAVIAAFF